MFETVINVNAEDNFVIESDADNADGLNFLAGKTINFVNQQAFLGTVMAHTDGGVPNISIELTSVRQEISDILYISSSFHAPFPAICSE